MTSPFMAPAKSYDGLSARELLSYERTVNDGDETLPPGGLNPGIDCDLFCGPIPPPEDLGQAGSLYECTFDPTPLFEADDPIPDINRPPSHLYPLWVKRWGATSFDFDTLDSYGIPAPAEDFVWRSMGGLRGYWNRTDDPFGMDAFNIEIGSDVFAIVDSTIAIGDAAAAAAQCAITIGTSVYADGASPNAVVIGCANEAHDANQVVIGTDVQARSDASNAVVIGTSSECKSGGFQNVLVGTVCNSGTDSVDVVAIGDAPTVDDNCTDVIAIGDGLTVLEGCTDVVAIGDFGEVDESCTDIILLGNRGHVYESCENVIAIGKLVAAAGATGSIVVGELAASGSTNVVAVGNRVEVKIDSQNSIALGQSLIEDGLPACIMFNGVAQRAGNVMFGQDGMEVVDLSANSSATPLVDLNTDGTARFRGAMVTAFAAVSADTTLTVFDHTVNADASGGAVVVTPPASGLVAGQVFVVRKTDASGNGVSFVGTVDGVTNPSVSTQYARIYVQYNGTDWNRMAA